MNQQEWEAAARQQRIEDNSTSWREAATGGLYLGLAMVGVMVVGYLLRNSTLGLLVALLNVIVIIYFDRRHGARMQQHYGDRGFSFTQALGFLLRMMLFAGVLAGLGQFVMQSYVDPAYYESLTQQTIEVLYSTPPDAETIAATTEAMHSPITMIISGIATMLLYGGIMALAVSIFLKRPPTPPSILK